MTLPSFNAEQSLYRSSRHYRSSALTSVVGGIRPSDGGNLPQSDNVPPGSYQESCFNCLYDGEADLLTCACYNEDVCANFAALSYVSSSCQGCDIYNSDGFLGCCLPLPGTAARDR